LKKLNRFMEQLEECITSVEANRHVCAALIKFYRQELLQDPKLQGLQLDWINNHHEEVQKTIDDANARIQVYSENINDMLRRAAVVQRIGRRREDTVSIPFLHVPVVVKLNDLPSRTLTITQQIHRFVQDRNERTMRDLAEFTRQDSAGMRVFATVTLILLPMSVVSVGSSCPFSAESIP
jgi:uncharacterized protein YPO0396